MKKKIIYEKGNLKLEFEYLDDIEYVKEFYEEGKIKFKGKYINYGKIGKHYDINGNLIFEGKYINDKKNGEGKEYYNNGNLKYEGYYINDRKINGKMYNYNGNEFYEIKDGKGIIKEFSDDGILEFEGEYFDGERKGKGKEYYKNGKIKFEGEYLKGKRNGKGKEYYDNGNLLFEGEYLNDERNGKGKEYDEKGLIKFEGVYLKGKIEEKSIEHKNDNILFEGKNEEIIQKEKIKEKCDYYNKNEKLIFDAVYNNYAKLQLKKDFFNAKIQSERKRYNSSDKCLKGNRKEKIKNEYYYNVYSENKEIKYEIKEINKYLYDVNLKIEGNFLKNKIE